MKAKEVMKYFYLLYNILCYIIYIIYNIIFFTLEHKVPLDLSSRSKRDICNASYASMDKSSPATPEVNLDLNRSFHIFYPLYILF